MNLLKTYFTLSWKTWKQNTMTGMKSRPASCTPLHKPCKGLQKTHRYSLRLSIRDSLTHSMILPRQSTLNLLSSKTQTSITRHVNVIYLKSLPLIWINSRNRKSKILSKYNRCRWNKPRLSQPKYKLSNRQSASKTCVKRGSLNQIRDSPILLIIKLKTFWTCLAQDSKEFRLQMNRLLNLFKQQLLLKLMP